MTTIATPNTTLISSEVKPHSKFYYLIIGIIILIIIGIIYYYKNNLFNSNNYLSSTIVKYGNKGTISCQDYCKGNYDGAPRGDCIQVINNDNNNDTIDCNDAPANLIGYVDLTCICNKQ